MFENSVDAKNTVDIDNENAFTSFIIGTGRWFVDKQSGIYRNLLIASNSIGLTTDQELAEYKKSIEAEYELYKRTPVGQSIVGKLGEAGILPMLIATPLVATANTVKAAAVTGATLGAIDSVSSVPIDPSIKNTAFHTLGGAALGTSGHAIVKAGVIGYNSVVKPVVAAGIDFFNSLKFNQHVQEELASVGKEILSKYISPLTHSIDYTKEKIASAITGALGEANLHYAFYKSLVKTLGYVREAAKYDSVHGFDGLYIKWNTNNQIERIVFAESKASSLPNVHGLSTNSEGVQQLSKKHIENVLEELLKKESTKDIAEKIIDFISVDKNWQHVTRLLVKTNGAGWTQCYEAVGGINFPKVTLRPISDEFKLVQKHANTLTLKRRAAAGLLPGVAASAADAADDDTQNVKEIEITAPIPESEVKTEANQDVNTNASTAPAVNSPPPVNNPPSHMPGVKTTRPIMHKEIEVPTGHNNVTQAPKPPVIFSNNLKPVKEPEFKGVSNNEQKIGPAKITIGKQESTPAPAPVKAAPPPPRPNTAAAPAAPIKIFPDLTPKSTVPTPVKPTPAPAPVQIPFKQTPPPAPVQIPFKQTPPPAPTPAKAVPPPPPKPAPAPAKAAPPPPRPAPTKAPAPPPPRPAPAKAPAPPPPRPAPAKAPAPPPPRPSPKKR